MKVSRVFAMPSPDTFSIKPIRNFVDAWARGAIVDPFARNCGIAEFTNDLNPSTSARHHMEAGDYLTFLHECEVRCDTLLFDPPYSPRQISECYKGIGREVTGADTQNAALYKRVRDAALPLLRPGSIVLSFGWNSGGMGIKRGFELHEILLVNHGGAHNDTICIAEVML